MLKREYGVSNTISTRIGNTMLQEKSLGRAKEGTGTSVNFSGTWINELQSTVTLTQINGVLSGLYESAVSADGKSTKGDLQGYADGDLIAFVVHGRDFRAITTLVGQFDPKAQRDTINSLWQMTSQVPAGDEWASINAGIRFFYKAIAASPRAGAFLTAP